MFIPYVVSVSIQMFSPSFYNCEHSFTIVLFSKGCEVAYFSTIFCSAVHELSFFYLAIINLQK
jgi:hypothetical protein